MRFATKTPADAISFIDTGAALAADAGVPYDAETIAYAKRDLESGTTAGLVMLRFSEGFYGK